MTVARRSLLDFDSRDNVMLTRMSQHTGLPMVHVIRLALRYYCEHGPWCIGTTGLREEVLIQAEGQMKPKTRRVRR